MAYNIQDTPSEMRYIFIGILLALWLLYLLVFFIKKFFKKIPETTIITVALRPDIQVGDIFTLYDCYNDPVERRYKVCSVTHITDIGTTQLLVEKLK
jgi:hypothetical protein